ncbi:MAG TPA: threonine/serine dehydratase [Actinomycetales bacterium]|nr:threonine/serine dehydratase [Actinomycetales bacterium]
MTLQEVPGALVTRADVVLVQRLIGDRVRRTPLLDVEAGVLGGTPVTLKLEQLQHTGSFKARGALSALLAAGELPASGVVAASGGNHGLAVAWAAGQLGVRATVFVPTTAPTAKVEGLRGLGADVRLVGDRYAQALHAAEEFRESTGAFAVHAYDDPAVVAGQGTLALELLDDLADRRHGVNEVDTVLVAVGGGGLASGVAAALDGRAEVVGVEPEGSRTWNEALAAGQPVDVEVGGVAADALGATRLGGTPWHTLTSAGARSVVVSPRAVFETRQLLWQRLRLIVEPGGAVAPAALLSGAYTPRRGERIAVIICGANTDPTSLQPE